MKKTFADYKTLAEIKLQEWAVCQTLSKLNLEVNDSNEELYSYEINSATATLWCDKKLVENIANFLSARDKMGEERLDKLSDPDIIKFFLSYPKSTHLELISAYIS